MLVYTAVEASEDDNSAVLAAGFFTELRDYMMYHRRFFGRRDKPFDDNMMCLRKTRKQRETEQKSRQAYEAAWDSIIRIVNNAPSDISVWLHRCRGRECCPHGREGCLHEL